MATPQIDIGRLSLDERLRLVEQLWESLAEAPHSIPFREGGSQTLGHRRQRSTAEPGLVMPRLLPLQATASPVDVRRRRSGAGTS